MADQTDTVYVFKTALRSARLPTYHARSDEIRLDIRVKHTRCGRLAATWLPGQPQLWRVTEVHTRHAKSFAAPCRSCYPNEPAP